MENNDQLNVLQEQIQSDILSDSKKLLEIKKRITFNNKRLNALRIFLGEGLPDFLKEIKRVQLERLASNRPPLHTTELHTHLIEKGFALPGRGDIGAIISRLRLANFKRVGRGTYIPK
jgi:hypothetical protein